MKFLFLLLQLATAAHGQTGQELPIPTGPALEQDVRAKTYAGEFGEAREHFLKTCEFLRQQAATLAPSHSNVFNPFGGVDPSAFALFDADTVVSVGLESFGTPEQIAAQLKEVAPLHAVASYLAAHGYIRSEVGGYWSLGRKVGADALVLIKHVLGGKLTGLRFLDREQRHVEITFELKGRTRMFVYFQSNMSATPSETLLTNYGVRADIAPELIKILESREYGAILSKATMEQQIHPEIWTALAPSLNKGVVWMGDGSGSLSSRYFVEKIVNARLVAGWSYQTDRALVPVIRLRTPTEGEVEAAKPVEPKGWLKKIFSSLKTPPLNPSPDVVDVEQPLPLVCQEFLTKRKAALQSQKPRQSSSAIQIRQ